MHVELRTACVAAAVLLAGGPKLVAAAVSEKPKYALRLVSGTFHGPGALPDSGCPQGLLAQIEFERPLHGETHFFSNGPDEPNVPGGLETDGKTDGLLSDGTPFNEHAWGGIAEVGGGAMRLMVVVSGRGPNQGREIYRLDADYHLTITTDLALDPGFPEGIVVRDNLRITTGVNWVPSSLQTQQQLPGGQDRAGTLPSLAPVVGRLGDFDRDGRIDGKIVGAANVPLGHMFSPGAPVLIERDFVSDIPVKRLDAALLTIANVTSYVPVWDAYRERHAQGGPVGELLAARLPEYLRAIDEALEAASQLLTQAGNEVARLPVARWTADLAGARRNVATAREWVRAMTRGQAPPAPVAEALRSTFALARRLTGEIAPHATLRPN